MRFKDLGELFFAKRRALVETKALSTASLKADIARWGKILPLFRDYEASAITAHELDTYFDGLIARGLSGATRNRYRALLHCFFEYAKRAGMVAVNPVSGIRALSEKIKRRKVGHWQSGS